MNHKIQAVAIICSLAASGVWASGALMSSGRLPDWGILIACVLQAIGGAGGVQQVIGTRAANQHRMVAMDDSKSGMLDALLELEEGLGERELQFVEDLDKRWRNRSLTAKQAAWLQRIYDEKCC